MSAHQARRREAGDREVGQGQGASDVTAMEPGAPMAPLLRRCFMQHHACAAVIGLLTAAFLAPVSPSHAASADPTGYWIKPDAERESKIHVFKCGKGRSQLC